MLWQDMTKSKSRKRNPPRGILTPTEEERLRKGSVNRQLIFNVRRKTIKSIMTDLPLIFEKIGLERLNYDLPPKYKNIIKESSDIVS
jgi:hypothetical protein